MRFTRMWMLQLMMGLCLALGTSARAEAPLEPEQLAQGTLAERQEAAARHVLSTGPTHSLAVSSSGEAWVWGTGSGAQLGTRPEHAFGTGLPVRMPRMSGVRSVSVGSTGSHTLALMENGTVEAWGENFFGQLGNGTTSSPPGRVQVLGLTQVVSLSTSANHSLAVRADGSVWAWGWNSRGQLGDGTTTMRLVPTPVLGLSQVVAVTAGASYSLALKQDGTVWAWGNNSSGQLGDGTQTRRLTPVQVPGLTDVVAIESRLVTSYAVRADGTVWAWGDNTEGGLGEGTLGDFRTTPAPVPGLTRVVSVAVGLYHALALRQDGTVWAWGNNRHDQLGTGPQDGPSQPQPVHGLGGVVAIAAGSYHSLALRRDGSVHAWGHNYYGAMGTGTHGRMTPGQVELKDVRAVASNTWNVLAVRGDGSVWHWGSDGGLAIEKVVASPERVSGLPKAVAVGANTDHSLVVAEDGTVWAWGDNSRGQLGDGTVGERRDTPAPVAGLSNVVAVTAGYRHSLALKRDGTVWAWGANHLGQLGDMTLNDSALPVQVQGLEGVSSIATWTDLSAAVKRDGTVWTWGLDEGAQFYGYTPPYPAAPVPGLSNVVKVSMRPMGLLALRADGTVGQWYLLVDWAAPYPDSALASLTGGVDLAVSDSTAQLLRADGTVWNFGGNTLGERGFPTQEATSLELAQVPGLTGVTAVFSQSTSVYALRADGTLMSWGTHGYGQLGIGESPLHLRPDPVLLPCKLKDLSTAEAAREQHCHAAP